MWLITVVIKIVIKKKKKEKHKFIDEEGYDIDDNGFRKIEDDDELEKRERKLLKR